MAQKDFILAEGLHPAIVDHDIFVKAQEKRAKNPSAKTGYDLPVIKAMAEVCKASIVASGGAGKMEHFLEAVQAGANVLLAASVFHFHMIDIPELKKYLAANGVKVRL